MSDSASPTEAETVQEGGICAEEPPHRRDRAESIRPWMRHYLAELRASGVHARAARAAQVNERTAREWRAKVPEFEEAVKEAEEEAMDEVEAGAIQDAIHGSVVTRKDGDGNIIETRHAKDYGHVHFMLGRKRRAIYGDKLDVNMTGAIASIQAEPAAAAEIVRGLLARMIAEKKTVDAYDNALNGGGEQP